MLEIEKKFKPGKDFERRLLKYGGKYLKDVHFNDTYYDSETFALTSNDHWLRKRDNQWELKCSLSSKGEQSSVKIDQYEEFSNETEIIYHLSLNPDVDSKRLQGKSTVEDAIDVLGIKPIATFDTFRVKYQLPGGFHIDLDKTNFGYELGEIELICQNKEEVDETTAKILDMGEKLGKFTINRRNGRFVAWRV